MLRGGGGDDERDDGMRLRGAEWDDLDDFLGREWPLRDLPVTRRAVGAGPGPWVEAARQADARAQGRAWAQVWLAVRWLVVAAMAEALLLLYILVLGSATLQGVQ